MYKLCECPEENGVKAYEIHTSIKNDKDEVVGKECTVCGKQMFFDD